ncbi:MAG TPA: uracil-DNA glycosylase [Clostridia bacterium]|nr:uracil-DNA glycosylase [Clostridia bacterium]
MVSRKGKTGLIDNVDQIAFDFAATPKIFTSPFASVSIQQDAESGVDGVLGPSKAKDDLVASSIEELRAQTIQCRKCHLRDGCRGVVFGEGNPNAVIMFVGEGPGSVEDELGRPFVGPAGQLLDRILAAAGFKREEVYITNVVKCRPPNNRVPTPVEAVTCYPYLKSEISLVKPKILVCLGATSLQTLVDPAARITRTRGTWFDKGDMKVIATYHPAALLRDQSKKKPVWEDFIQIRRQYEKIIKSAGSRGA